MTDEDDNGANEHTVRRARPGPPPAATDVEPAFEPTRVRAITSERDPLIGATLGEYRVLAMLGEGAMGLVYRGEQPVIGRPVAIKVLKREFASDTNHARRFLEEARSVSAARHPGIIDVFGFGNVPTGEPYLVMELLEGEALDVTLAREKRLPADEAVALLLPILSALSAAHAAGVIHRDLKPANIFVVKLHDGSTFPKLLDFGLARRGEAGAAVRQTSVGGTPLYLAPEQARGEAVGPQADLYSLGCVMYEMLAGRPPFNGDNLYALLHQHSRLTPPPLRGECPDVPAALEQVVHSMLEKDPGARPASALEVRKALEGLGAHRPAPRPRKKGRTRTADDLAVTSPSLPQLEAVRATTPSMAALPAVRARPWVRWVGVALAVVVGSAVILYARAQQTQPPRPDAVRASEPVALRPAPEPEPDPLAELTPPTVHKPTKHPRPTVARHTRDELNQRRKRLEERAHFLPADVRRAAYLRLEENQRCKAALDVCWKELDDVEHVFFAPGN